MRLWGGGGGGGGNYLDLRNKLTEIHHMLMRKDEAPDGGFPALFYK